MVVKLHRFTRADYHRLAEAGVLQEDDRVELIEGVITRMSPIGPRHSATVDFLTHFFVERLGSRAIARVQGAIGLGPRTEPQPDLALLRPAAHRYRRAHPEAEDIFLLIEVADVTGAVDRGRKARLYARHGVQEYWVVDLPQECVVVHTQPAADGYDSVREVRAPESVAPLAFPDVRLDITELLA
jgi:Uma2 family endonuclease